MQTFGIVPKVAALQDYTSSTRFLLEQIQDALTILELHSTRYRQPVPLTAILTSTAGRLELS